jgi:hypothetical protein
MTKGGEVEEERREIKLSSEGRRVEYRAMKKEIFVSVMDCNNVNVIIRRNGGEGGYTQRKNRISSIIFPFPSLQTDLSHLSQLVVQFVKLDSKFLK